MNNISSYKILCLTFDVNAMQYSIFRMQTIYLRQGEITEILFCLQQFVGSCGLKESNVKLLQNGEFCLQICLMVI